MIAQSAGRPRRTPPPSSPSSFFPAHNADTPASRMRTRRAPRATRNPAPRAYRSRPTLTPRTLARQSAYRASQVFRTLQVRLAAGDGACSVSFFHPRHCTEWKSATRTVHGLVVRDSNEVLDCAGWRILLFRSGFRAPAIHLIVTQRVRAQNRTAKGVVKVVPAPGPMTLLQLAWPGTHRASHIGPHPGTTTRVERRRAAVAPGPPSLREPGPRVLPEGTRIGWYVVWV